MSCAPRARARIKSVTLIAALLLAAPGAAVAQPCAGFPCPTTPENQPGITARGEALALGVNAMLGGITAAVARRDHPSVWKAFARGVLGGAINYAGKRMTVANFDGAIFLGRQTASLGVSMVADARDGRRFLQRTVIPLGLARLYIDREAKQPVTARLDVGSTLLTIFRTLERNTRFDLGTTVSTGAPVLVRPLTGPVAGSQALGVIGLADDTPVEMREALVHEAIHVIQSDFTFLAWGEPVERKIFSKLEPSGRITRFLDVRLDILVWGLFDQIPYDRSPWEDEAYFLTRKPSENAGARMIQQASSGSQ
jgi:hypothetical protein